MTSPSPSDLLAAATVEEAVRELRPDYRALLVTVEGITAEPGDAFTEELLRRAEEHARTHARGGAGGPAPARGGVAAYRAFGAKPQRTRKSLEALTRRARATGRRASTG